MVQLLLVGATAGLSVGWSAAPCVGSVGLSSVGRRSVGGRSAVGRVRCDYASMVGRRFVLSVSLAALNLIFFFATLGLFFGAL